MSSAESSLAVSEKPVSTEPSLASRSGAPAKFGATDAGLILMAAIWGGHYTVIKYGLATMAPFTFSAIRMVSALLILTALAATVRDTPRPSWRDIKAMMALGLIGNGLYQLLFMIGMTQTRAGIAALIIAASPAWVAIVGRLMGRERGTGRSWSGIGLQLVGVTCVVLSTNALDGPGGGSLHTFLIILCGIIWSVYTVLLQPYTTRVHPLHLSVATLSSGAALMFVVALPGLVTLDFGAIATSAWWALSYSTILAMIVAYLLYYRGIRVIGPTRTAVYGNLQPAIAIAVAWVLLSEAPGLWQWVGTFLILAGLLLSRSAPIKPITDTHPIP
ncbi:MAG: DMT family transporter [Phycisphaerae bacterium]|nr:DMT family transporter [Gemmatimonadaceae bacterium]